MEREIMEFSRRRGFKTSWAEASIINKLKDRIECLKKGGKLETILTNAPLSSRKRSFENEDICNSCDEVCVQTCPTGAIGEDDFLIRAERCLTYYNEKPGNLPQWIDARWHNTLIGCRICEKVCPENSTILRKNLEVIDFTEEETTCVLEENISSLGEFPHITKCKIENIGMDRYLRVFRRNLELLFERAEHGQS
jgi:epoxyqueuosine reductase